MLPTEAKKDRRENEIVQELASIPTTATVATTTTFSFNIKSNNINTAKRC